MSPIWRPGGTSCSQYATLAIFAAEDFLLRPRMSRIHYDKKLFDYPLRATNALRNSVLEMERRLRLLRFPLQCALQCLVER